MINYPSGVKKKTNVATNVYENRGMNFEKELNDANKYYRDIDKAIIYKKPTSIKVVKMDNEHKCIDKAYFEMPSTTDYNGIYKGYYIDFEAKETINKTSFPLSNIHEHQIEHLIRVKKHGGLAFIIVNFKKLGEVYILDIDDFKDLDRHSIPLSLFKEKGKIVKQEYVCTINYLKAVDELYSI